MAYTYTVIIAMFKFRTTNNTFVFGNLCIVISGFEIIIVYIYNSVFNKTDRKIKLKSYRQEGIKFFWHLCSQLYRLPPANSFTNKNCY